MSILYLEPYYGGSHKQMIDLLQREFGGVVYTLPDNKWHWRMRLSGLHFAELVPPLQEPHPQFKVLFASSVLNLCELLGLRPDLQGLHKVLYFHENQLIYPVRKQQERDFQYGYIQILSCLVADQIIFNSHFNMRSFLAKIDPFINTTPTPRPGKNLADKIAPKCTVLYYPIDIPRKYMYHVNNYNSQSPALCSACHTKEMQFSNETPLQSLSEAEKAMCTSAATYTKEMQFSNETLQSLSEEKDNSICTSISGDLKVSLETKRPGGVFPESPPCNDKAISNDEKSMHRRNPQLNPLHILWPHRWEHDKGPEVFTQLIKKLLSNEQKELYFKVSILGTHTADIPGCFKELFELLGDRLIHCGTVDIEEYWSILSNADIVISTAKHEFFGVAMIEATSCGCYPLCPNDLVYPEIFPEQCLYNTEQQLFKKVKNLCQRPHLAKEYRQSMSFNIATFQWDTLKRQYESVFF